MWCAVFTSWPLLSKNTYKAKCIESSFQLQLKSISGFFHCCCSGWGFFPSSSQQELEKKFSAFIPPSSPDEIEIWIHRNNVFQMILISVISPRKNNPRKLYTHLSKYSFFGEGFFVCLFERNQLEGTSTHDNIYWHALRVLSIFHNSFLGILDNSETKQLFCNLLRHTKAIYLTSHGHTMQTVSDFPHQEDSWLYLKLLNLF